MKNLNLTRPLCFFDIEGTGLDVVNDRIVELSIRIIQPEEDLIDLTFTRYFNPGVPIPAEVTAIHGITNEMVKNAPDFAESAHFIMDLMKGCDLAGYNLWNYDIPIIAEEFDRAGLEFSLEGVNVIDVGNIFKKKEERSLSAAVRFYTGKDLENAHTAEADNLATVNVFKGQLDRYSDLMAMGDVSKIAEFSQFEKRVDLAGKIILNSNGEPIYNIGKAKGKRVEDDPGFGRWMLGKGFTRNTKTVIERLLDAPREEAMEEEFRCDDLPF